MTDSNAAFPADAGRACAPSGLSQSPLSQAQPLVPNADEAWRPALIAYWRREGCSQRADNLIVGTPFDYLDERAIEAIEAALAALREAA